MITYEPCRRNQIPFPRVPAPNKRHVEVAPAESDPVEISTLLEHTDTFFFELYENDMNHKYTRCCLHCKKAFKSLRPGKNALGQA